MKIPFRHVLQHLQLILLIWPTIWYNIHWPYIRNSLTCKMQCHHVLFLAKLWASRVILAPRLKCSLLSGMECHVMVCERPNHLQNQEFCNTEYSSHCTHELLTHFASLIKQCLSPPAPEPGPDKMP